MAVAFDADGDRVLAQAVKGELEIPRGGPYLLTHSVGCLPRSASVALQEHFLSPWATDGSDAWPVWLSAVDRFKRSLSDLLGGTPDQWCPQATVSSAVAKIVSGLTLSPKRTRILASEHAFPSIAYALYGLAQLGLKVDLIGSDPRDLTSWSGVRDPDVAAVVLMHVHSNTGWVTPVAEVAAMARSCGVFTVVDIAQSAGILPIDVEVLGVDAVVGTSVKWLSGGPGACFAWLSPEVTNDICPIDRGWFSHSNPFSMDIREFEFAPDARRLWGGTPSIAPVVLATVGIELISGIGVSRIRDHNIRLSTLLFERTNGTLGDPSILAQQGGTLCLDLGPAPEAALKDIGARFDRRGRMLRMSFAICNDEQDVEQIADCLMTTLRNDGATS